MLIWFVNSLFIWTFWFEKYPTKVCSYLFNDLIMYKKKLNIKICPYKSYQISKDGNHPSKSFTKRPIIKAQPPNILCRQADKVTTMQANQHEDLIYKQANRTVTMQIDGRPRLETLTLEMKFKNSKVVARNTSLISCHNRDILSYCLL